ncbi:MAG: DUF2784 domain-containing protein [Gammaproteobacteria bacterium]|nr:DUF2784 domain-containing protein [Gammaproteobacteria bacterium]
MTATLLAELVLLLHLLFILFAIFGGLLILYKRWWAWWHLPCVLWASAVNLAGWVCPLTSLENWLRSIAGQTAGYEGGFIAHYIAPLVYPAGMTQALALMAGVGVIVWNILVYGVLVYRLIANSSVERL